MSRSWLAGRAARRMMRGAAGVAAWVFAGAAAHAQYQVHHWTNFENGLFPPQYAAIGPNFQGTVRVAPLDAMAARGGLPAAFRAADSARETGSCALMIRSDPKSVLSGIGTGVTLFRDRLGDTGRALFQADFFVPGTEGKLTNVAVLAMIPPPAPGAEPPAFYRWGIAKDRSMYFSHVKAGSLQPVIKLDDKALFAKLPRPGWHRLAIVFEGRTRIRCYVDGFEPAFSPIEDGELRNLQIGIMNAEAKDVCDTYVDNLSIQWTGEDVPLPDSPYAASWGGGAPAAPALVAWSSADEGRARSLREGKPMLVCFQAPRAKATEELERILATNPSARSFLGQHVAVKVDVNQLGGGTVAQSQNIVRVPTLVVYRPDGTEAARATFKANDSWETIAPMLGM